MPGGRGTPDNIADALNEVQDSDVELTSEMLVMAMDNKEYIVVLSPLAIAKGIARCIDQPRKDALRHVVCHAMQGNFSDWASGY